jgi:hypothetical protein
MADTRSAATPPRSTTDRPPSAGDRRGLRITLLSLAVTILLLGAATASVYGYAAMVHPK